MEDRLQQILGDTLEYLMTLDREGIRTEEARVRLNSLQQHYPEIGIELVWEEETYDRSLHYDALLHLEGKGTLSLSFCPDRSLPWPMRSVHRWKEQDLLKVNNTVLSVAEAIVYLDFIWNESPLARRLLDTCILREALEKNPVELSDAELQEAMDTFRSERKLYKAADTLHWLERHGITPEQLESSIAEQAQIVKLRKRVTGDRLNAPANLDKVARDALERDLFEEWLSEQRHRATIEWYWGDVTQTSQVV